MFAKGGYGVHARFPAFAAERLQGRYGSDGRGDIHPTAARGKLLVNHSPAMSLTRAVPMPAFQPAGASADGSRKDRLDRGIDRGAVFGTCRVATKTRSAPVSGPFQQSRPFAVILDRTAHSIGGRIGP